MPPLQCVTKQQISITTCLMACMPSQLLAWFLTLAVCLQTAMHEVFEEEDMRQIFRWLQKFLNNPYSEDDQLVPAGMQSPKPRNTSELAGVSHDMCGSEVSL